MPVAKGTSPVRITDADMEQFRTLHANGKGRNEIAKIMGRPWSTITLMARRADVRFVGQQAESTAKIKELAAARRAELSLKFLDDADALREQLWDPTTLINFGGRDNTVATYEVEQPPARDKQYLAMAAGTLVDRSLKLSEADRNAGADGARSVLGKLGDLLKAAADPEEPVRDGEPD